MAHHKKDARLRRACEVSLIGAVLAVPATADGVTLWTKGFAATGDLGRGGKTATLSLSPGCTSGTLSGTITLDQRKATGSAPVSRPCTGERQVFSITIPADKHHFKRGPALACGTLSDAEDSATTCHEVNLVRR